MRASFFIDGFNLFHAIDDNQSFHKYKWLDLLKLAKCCVPSSIKIGNVYYFTALATWAPDKVQRHKTYIRALRSVGVKPVYGAFRLKDVTCRICRKTFDTYVEKETDVNIAIKLLQGAFRDEYDQAVLVSGDSDLIPAIEAVKETFPDKQLRMVIPIGRRAELLKETTHSHMKLKEHHLSSCQFPDKLIIDGETLSRPPSWK